jgi:hypothetical protein
MCRSLPSFQQGKKFIYAWYLFVHHHTAINIRGFRCSSITEAIITSRREITASAQLFGIPFFAYLEPRATTTAGRARSVSSLLAHCSAKTHWRKN